MAKTAVKPLITAFTDMVEKAAKKATDAVNTVANEVSSVVLKKTSTQQGNTEEYVIRYPEIKINPLNSKTDITD